MSSWQLFGLIPVLGWLCGVIGLYRLGEDYNGFYRGASDLFGSQREKDLLRYQARQKFKAAYASPKHRLDRYLIWIGGAVFAGSIAAMMVYGVFMSQQALR